MYRLHLLKWSARSVAKQARSSGHATQVAIQTANSCRSTSILALCGTDRCTLLCEFVQLICSQSRPLLVPISTAQERVSAPTSQGCRLRPDLTTAWSHRSSPTQAALRSCGNVWIKPWSLAWRGRHFRLSLLRSASKVQVYRPAVCAGCMWGSNPCCALA